MKTKYHEGELAVQQRAGVTEMARRVSRGIHESIPDAAQEFLAEQEMVVLAAADAEGRIWASLLTGEAGFVGSIDEHTVRIDADPASTAVAAALAHSIDRSAVGLLAIDLATRRRMRLNGRIERTLYEQGSQNITLIVKAQEVYANCPKYIQAREISRETVLSERSAPPSVTTELTAAQARWISQADTFFIASAAPNAGADASHRGGNPGFVRIVDSHTLVFPDYSGNTMFNTLGNIAANPHAGLLFVDFETGSTLELTGEAFIDWDAAHRVDVPGAERLVEFRVGSAVETPTGAPLRFRLLNRSPFNPS